MAKPEIGSRNGRLTIVELLPGGKHPKVKCRCDCGTERTIQQDNLARTHSCGCLKRERTGRLNLQHGLSASPEFRVWCDMRDRCSRVERRDFQRYGGRGITVCERWMTFSNFYADMGQRPSPQHSIDRRDTNGNYEPDNCRWATSTEQRLNQRRQVLYTHDGVTDSLKALARRAGLSYSAVHQRVTTMNWSVHDALSKPVQKRIHKSES